MICSIYKISNTINDKIYIGQTWQSLSTRFGQHKSPNSKDCSKLHRAFNKYGRENFSIELIVSIEDQLTADAYEKFWINVYNSVTFGYNIKEGGSKGKHSIETRIKMSKIATGKKHTEESKTKMSKSKTGNRSHFGKKHSEESKQKMAAHFKNKTWKIIDGKRIWIEKESNGI